MEVKENSFVLIRYECKRTQDAGDPLPQPLLDSMSSFLPHRLCVGKVTETCVATFGTEKQDKDSGLVKVDWYFVTIQKKADTFLFTKWEWRKWDEVQPDDVHCNAILPFLIEMETHCDHQKFAQDPSHFFETYESMTPTYQLL